MLLVSSAIYAAGEPADTKQVFATVGGEVITVDEYQANLHAGMRQRLFHGGASGEKQNAVRKEIAQSLVERMMLRQEARRRHITPDVSWVDSRLKEITLPYRSSPKWNERRAEVESALREQLGQESMISQLQQQIRTVTPPTEGQLQEFYRAHPEKFTTPERLRVSLILLKVEPWAAGAVWQAAHDEAQRLINKLKGGADFAGLARLHSADDSAMNGGDLGYVHKGMLAEEAQKMLETMKKGDISPPLQILQGIAIFRLDERIEPVLNGFDQASERVRGLLTREMENTAWQAFMEELRNRTTVQIDESLL